MRVARVLQSEVAPRRWRIVLSCGHEVVVTCTRRPTRRIHPCEVCLAAARVASAVTS